MDPITPQQVMWSWQAECSWHPQAHHWKPSLSQLHPDSNYKCRTTYHDGRSRVCTKGCLHAGLPVHFRACMHNNQAPYVTVSKVSINKSVFLVEDVLVGKLTIGIQYDTVSSLNQPSQPCPLQCTPLGPPPRWGWWPMQVRGKLSSPQMSN